MSGLDIGVMGVGKATVYSKEFNLAGLNGSSFLFGFVGLRG